MAFSWKRLFVTLLSVGIASAVHGADFTLVKDGAARAAFRVGTISDVEAAESVRQDLELFNRHLKAVTGAELPVNGDASTMNRIRIELKPIDALDTRFNWSMDFPQEDEMRVVATTTSLFTALRQLLEEGCDARFLGTERCMFQFEPRRDVAIEIRPRKNAAANYTLLRDVYGAMGHRRELGLTDDRLFKYSHGIPIYAFPVDYYNGQGWPEAIMPVIDGKKLARPGDNPYMGWQPCYSNPETARLAAENIREHLRKHPEMLSITLGVNDNSGFCECDACKAMNAGAEKSIFSNDPTNHSASYYTFVNRVAEALAEEFPKLRIGLLAYTATIIPPAFKVHPSVVPMMTLDSHSAAIDPAVRRRHEDVMRRWGQNVRETGIWDYSWGGGYWIPRVDFANRAQRLKFLYANGGRAYFGENSMPDALDGPKTYLTSRLLEDVNADTDVILTEWFTRFAGKAAEVPLRELYRLCTDYWRTEEMKESPFWAARNYIYSYPYASQFFALTPGFSETLLNLARQVRACAVTDGEKARAEVLLRHFERLDCMAMFKGIAYMSCESGELPDAVNAKRMLDDFASRAEELFTAWRGVKRYFLEEPDFDQKDVYGRRDAYQELSLLAEQFGKAAAFRNAPAVTESLRRIAAMECIPAETRAMLNNIVEQRLENAFSNVNLSNPLDSSKIDTSLPYEEVDDDGFEGGRAIRVWPGRPNGDPDPVDIVLRHVSAFQMTQDLRPGIWMVSVTVRAEAKAAKGDMSAWLQADGVNLEWEDLHMTALAKGSPHTFVQVRCVNDTEDGLNLKLRLTGFEKDESLLIGDIKVMRLGDVSLSGRSNSLSINRITARDGSVREAVRGEAAIVNRVPEAYPFAHALVMVQRILPDERLVFTIRATLPEGATTGRIGAIVYEQKNGDWVQGQTVIWDGTPSSTGWTDFEGSVTGAELGKKKGRFLLILFKMKGTDAVAVSRLSWRVQP